MLELAGEVRDLKKREALDMAEQLLDAEAQIGKLTREIPSRQGMRTELRGTDAPKSKEDVIAGLGLEQTQVKRFETLAAHPEVIAQVKADARENDDLPTRTEVLRRVAGATSRSLAFHSARR